MCVMCECMCEYMCDVHVRVCMCVSVFECAYV